MRMLWRIFAGLLAAALLGCDRPAPDADAAAVLGIIGGPGHTAGRFNRPRGMDYNAEAEHLYVIDWDGRIQVFTPAGAFRGSWRMPKVAKGKPEGLHLRQNGNVLIADTHYSRVMEYSPQGELVRSFGSYGEEQGQFIYPVAVCTDAEDNIYVAEYGGADRVQKFDPDGNFLKDWGRLGTAPGAFQRPSGLIVGPEQQLYVADAVNHRIQVFDLEGKLLRILGEPGRGEGQLNYPYDLDFRDSLLYVLEYGNNRVQRFTRDGESRGTLGSPGSGPGEFAAPWKLAVAPDIVYVSDTNNSRVVKLRF